MPAQPFLAMITPVSEGGGGWDTFPKPTPQPPVYPSHPIYNPGYPSHPIYNPGYPSHPIVIPPPYPSHPIAGGPWPSNPIVIPPGGAYPPVGGGGGSGEAPSQPILLPPGEDPRWALVYVPAMGGWTWALVPGNTQPPAEGGENPSP